MSNAWRLLMMAAVVNLAAAGAVSAQTVIVKGAAPGNRAELVVDAAKAAEGAVGPDGQATLLGTVPMNESTNRPEMDARVFVDVCEGLHRIHVVNRNRQPLAREDGCERREINAVFWVQQRSTVVVDVAGAIPTVLLRQGEYDPDAIGRPRLSPRGLVLSAGGGWGSIDDVLTSACGDVGQCDGKGSGGTYTAAATLWILRPVAIEGMYIKPRKASFEGNGNNFRFTHFLDTEIFAVGGKLAAPFGPVRLYGHGGGAYHRSVSSTTQENDPLEFTGDDGVEYTVPGGTQTVETRTEGWGWYAGGGIEGWVTPRVALFGEGLVVKLKGDPTFGTDLPMDRLFIGVYGGIRLRVF